MTGEIIVHDKIRPEWLAKRTIDQLNAGGSAWWRVVPSGHKVAQEAYGIIGGTDQLWVVNKLQNPSAGFALWYWASRLGQFDFCSDAPRPRSSRRSTQPR